MKKTNKSTTKKPAAKRTASEKLSVRPKRKDQAELQLVAIVARLEAITKQLAQAAERLAQSALPAASTQLPSAPTIGPQPNTDKPAEDFALRFWEET
jgi:hypothetical protein